VSISDPRRANLTIPTVLTEPARAQLFAFKTHPRINKDAFAEQGVLAMKDAAAGFPVGAPVSVLRWRTKAATLGESDLPLILNAWVNPSARGVDISLEYEVKHVASVRSLTVLLPVPAAAGPSVDVRLADGEGRVGLNAARTHIQWTFVGELPRGSSGAVEIAVVGSKSADAYFPVDVTFEASEVLCGLKVAAEGVDSHAVLLVEQYRIE
jgi:hypothetical protein